MLTEANRKAFFEKGFTRISGAVRDEVLANAADDLWRGLAQHGIYRDKPESWWQTRPRGIQTLSRSDTFDHLFKDSAEACLDQLLGVAQWEAPVHWGQLLLSLPNDNDWIVPHTAWHLDLPEQIDNLECPGVQLFICMGDIVDRCGATVVACGTHHLVQSLLTAEGLPLKRASATLRSRLGHKSEWFRGLTGNVRGDNRNDFFMNLPHEEGDVPLRVEELTGRKGDLILMHPYLFHAPAPNIGPAIRVALTQRIYSRKAQSVYSDSILN